MVNRISGNAPPAVPRSVESPSAQEPAKTSSSGSAAQAERSALFEGMSGGERAEMQRFMALKNSAESSGQAKSGVRNLGAATPLLFEAQAGESLQDRAKAQFADFDLTQMSNAQLNNLDERDPRVMERLPQSVQDSYQHYYDNAEANDWASVYLSKHQVGDDDVYMIATRTDGSDNYMELFDASGKPLASGEALEDDRRNWDSEFGACRARVIWD